MKGWEKEAEVLLKWLELEENDYVKERERGGI